MMNLAISTFIPKYHKSLLIILKTHQVANKLKQIKIVLRVNLFLRIHTIRVKYTKLQSLAQLKRLILFSQLQITLKLHTLIPYVNHLA